jgi:hypothetical protein
MNCVHCQLPIKLTPTAAERAASDPTGKTAAYYESLFDYHASCTILLRKQSIKELLNETQRTRVGTDIRTA